MSAKRRVMIVEDHTIVREGLRALLLANPEFEVVAEAADGRMAVQRVIEAAPELVLLDLSMPGMSGLDALRQIKSHNPRTKILVLTIHTDEEYIHACIKNGANGYIVKHATQAELMVAIDNVIAGKNHFSSEVTQIILSSYLKATKNAAAVSPWERLTHRERQVLKLIAEGSTNKRIGLFLDISAKTVEKHRANLMEKLNLHCTAGLTAFAMKHGLLEGAANPLGERGIS